MLLSTAFAFRTTNDIRERGQRGRRSARPRLEMLETRTLLSVDVVTNTNSSGPGSLLSTIGAASPGDTITFASDVTGTITVPSSADAGFFISENLDIQGPGADSLTISGNGEYGVFEINTGVTATIAGLTLANGNSDSTGGAIYSAGTLTINSCTFSDNFGLAGGAICDNSGGYSTDGMLTINNSTFSNNSGAVGGAIYIAGATVTVNNSTFADNSTLPARNGGSFGGAIFNYGGTLTVTDSTLSGNSAAAEGGGIDNTSGPFNAPATLILANTIIAGNTAPAGPDVSGSVTSLGSNLIGNSSGGSGFAATDLVNVSPLLGPLQNNGGPTETMALLPGSPAIDSGSNYLIPAGITTDQRGEPREVNGVDIGAFRSSGVPGLQHGGQRRRLAAHRPG